MSNPPSLRSEVLSAFRTRLMTAASIEQWVVRFANREANGAAPLAMNALYLEETPFSMTTEQTSLADPSTTWRETTGTWQVLLCTPVGMDLFDALDFADELDVLYANAPLMTLADGETPICIVNVLVGTPRPVRTDDPWVRIPVVFTYRVNSHT